MSMIIPFHGVRYDTTVVGDIKQVVAPPYDIIDAAGQKALHDRHPQTHSTRMGFDQPGAGPLAIDLPAPRTLRDGLKRGDERARSRPL